MYPSFKFKFAAHSQRTLCPVCSHPHVAEICRSWRWWFMRGALNIDPQCFFCFMRGALNMWPQCLPTSTRHNHISFFLTLMILIILPKFPPLVTNMRQISHHQYIFCKRKVDSKTLVFHIFYLSQEVLESSFYRTQVSLGSGLWVRCLYLPPPLQDLFETLLMWLWLMMIPTQY